MRAQLGSLAGSLAQQGAARAAGGLPLKAAGQPEGRPLIAAAGLAGLASRDGWCCRLPQLAGYYSAAGPLPVSPER